jgi:imidazolonepropionase-like amidohydrolase
MPIDLARTAVWWIAITITTLLAVQMAAGQHGPLPGIDTGFPETSTIIIEGGQYLDVHAGVFRPNPGILIRNGRLMHFGAHIDDSADGYRLRLEDDRFILPGLIDLHAHYNMDLIGEGRVDETVYNPIVYLANGVTTTFPAGEFDPGPMRNARDRINRGDQIGPRILLSGAYFGPDNPEWRRDLSTDEIYAMVDAAAAGGAAGLKAKGAGPEHIEALVRRAHQHGLTVTGHLDSGFRGSTNARDAIRMGIDRIEHILGGDALDPDRPAYPVWNEVDTTSAEFRSIVRMFIDNHVYFSATLTAPVYFASPEETPGFDDFAREATFFTAYVQEHWTTRNAERTRSPLFDALHLTMLRTTRAFFDAGGGHLITLGTDKPSWGDFLPGFSAHREMHAMVRAGIPAADVLRIATLNSARAINHGDVLGSLEAGKLADLFVVRGNPLDDITNTRNVEVVMKSGQLFDPTRLLDAARGSIGPTGPEDHDGWRR